MDGFLDADCVIPVLFKKGVLTQKNWKLARGTTNIYNITFELSSAPRIIGFTIYIKGTYHCIGLTALLNQSRRFGIPVDDIMVQCAINGIQ